MYANSLIAVSGLLSLVAAVPMAHEQHNHLHQHHARDYVWVTETEEAIVTIPVTQTVWLEPGETPPSDHQSNAQNNRPAYTSHAEHSPAASSPSSETPAPYVAPTTSSTSQYVAPTTSSTLKYVAPTTSSEYVPPPAPTSSSSSSVYTPPPAPTTSSTSQYAAPAYTPTASSSSAPPAYSAPASSSSAAPAASSSSSSSSSAVQAGDSSVQPVSNSVTGMAASGQSFTGDLTNYAVGMGSCGVSSTEDQIVVALSHVIMSQYNGGNPNANPLCGKTIGIKALDGTVHHATIVDTCPGCDVGSLDLPLAFFNTLTRVDGKVGDGRVKGVEWSFD